MPTLGSTLATERLRQASNLENVASATKIGTRFLKAIESDDFESLPGRVFARNFVRQYAEFLKLDSAAIIARFDDEQSIIRTGPVFLIEPERPSRSLSLNLPALADVFENTTLASFSALVFSIGLFAAGVWGFNHWRAGLPKPVQAAKTRPAAVVRNPAPQPEAPPPATDLDSPSITAQGASVHVQLAASDPCWTRIIADGKVLFTGILNAGETREVNAASVIDLRAGNAGALAVKLNGSDIPPLGPKGQTRTVTLTSSGAHVRTPIPEPVSEPL